MEAVASVSVSSADGGDPFLIFDRGQHDWRRTRVGRGGSPVGASHAGRRLGRGDVPAPDALHVHLLAFRFESTPASSRRRLGLDDARAAARSQSDDRRAVLLLRAAARRSMAISIGVTLMSGGYPLGAIVSASGPHWDIRGGVTDATPTRARSVFSSSQAPAATQLVVGGGVTPATGLRLGGASRLVVIASMPSRSRTWSIPVSSYGSGPRRMASSPRGAPLPDETADRVNVEGNTRLAIRASAGELVVDRFETLISPGGDARLQLLAVRTLSPHWFTAGRIVGASTPILTTPTPVRRAATSAEGTLGYR